jgi:hypothetical protein
VCVLSLIIFGLRKALTWYSQVPYGFRWFLRRGNELDSDCEGGDHSNVPAVHHPAYITVNQHFRMYAAEEPRYTKPFGPRMNINNQASKSQLRVGF